MSIYKIVISAIAALIFIVLMKNIKEEYALFTLVFINISLMTCGLCFLQPVLEYIENLESTFGINNGITKLLFKCTGIGLLCSFGAELCRDCGQNSLGGKIELLGKCGMICYCLPLIKTVFENAIQFIT